MLDSILAPTDFSEGSRASVEYAAKMAEQFGATLHLLHVGDAGVAHHEPGAPGAAAEIYHRAREERARHARMQMDELVDDMKRAHPGLRFESHFASGVPHAVILSVAEERHIGMIVMGTAGLTGLSHFLIGSTAERVVRLSKIPVLTVRVD